MPFHEELDAFDQRVKAEFPNADYMAELKIDGLSISLTYVDNSGRCDVMVLSVKISLKMSSAISDILKLDQPA